jgi:dephospho-CoA kinase
MVGIYIKALMKGASKVSPTIKSVKPNVPKTKKEKALSKLAIAKQKTKGSAAKLKQTLFNLKEDRKKLNLRENKMGGGMMGRRMGYSQGKLAVTPREKQLAAQYGDKKRITRGDVITAAKKKSGEEPMRDRMKQPLKKKGT